MSTTITNLPETSKVNGSDYLVLDQTDKTVKSTVSNFLTDTGVVLATQLKDTNGADLIQSSNGNTVQEELNNNLLNDREQWHRSLAEAGLTLVNGSFEEGATLNNKTDAVWYIAGGQCYSWDGALPKEVPNGSTPETSGGVGLGVWVSVGDASLRTELSSLSGANLVGYSVSMRYNEETVGWMLENLTDRALSSSDFPGDDAGEQINNGLDFLRSQNEKYRQGGTLNLPRETLNVSTPITLDRTPSGAPDENDEYTISGSGKGGTVLIAGNSFPPDKAVLTTNSANGNAVQGFKLKDFSIRGGKNGLRIETASRSIIDSIKVSGSGSDGIYVGNSWVNLYSQVLVDSSGGNGITFDNSLQKTSTTVLSGYQLKNKGSGWDFGFMNYSVAIATASDQNSQHGYKISRSEGFVLISPGAESNGGAGILAEASTSLGENKSVLIQGAFCHNNNKIGTYANLLYAVSTANTINRVKITDSTAHSSPVGSPDVVADGNECVVTIDNCVLPNGWESRNGGYIDWVHHTLYVQKPGITGATAICNLRGTQGHGRNEASASDSFAGEVTIVASPLAPSTATRRLAIYKLFICVAADTGVQCEVIKQLGYVSGNVPGSPSFTWSIGSSHELIATPIGSTAGTFYFEITTDSQVVALKR